MRPALALVVAIVLGGGTARADDELARARKAIADRDFNDHREAFAYDLLLGPHFAADRKTWTSRTRVLDAGAGNANFFRGLREAQGAGAPQMVAVSGAPAAGTGLDGIDFHVGLLGGDGRLERRLGLGTFDRIVDSMGASHYTGQLDRVVASYAALLRPGGRAYLHFYSGDLAITGHDGAPIEIEKWLAGARGLRADVTRVAFGESNILLVTLERTRGEVAVPRLLRTGYRFARPPVRSFQLTAGVVRSPVHWRAGPARRILAGAHAVTRPPRRPAVRRRGAARVHRTPARAHRF